MVKLRLRKLTLCIRSVFPVSIALFGFAQLPSIVPW